MKSNFPSINSVFPLLPSSDKKTLIFDIETNGLYDEVNEIFCIVIHDVHTNETTSYGPHGIVDALSIWTPLIISLVTTSSSTMFP